MMSVPFYAVCPSMTFAETCCQAVHGTRCNLTAWHPMQHLCVSFYVPLAHPPHWQATLAETYRKYLSAWFSHPAVKGALIGGFWDGVQSLRVVGSGLYFANKTERLAGKVRATCRLPVLYCCHEPYWVLVTWGIRACASATRLSGWPDRPGQVACCTDDDAAAAATHMMADIERPPMPFCLPVTRVLSADDACVHICVCLNRPLTGLPARLPLQVVVT